MMTVGRDHGLYSLRERISGGAALTTFGIYRRQAKWSDGLGDDLWRASAEKSFPVRLISSEKIIEWE